MNENMPPRPLASESLETTIQDPPQVEQVRRGWAPPRPGSKTTILAAAFGLLGIMLVLYAWRLPPFASRIESTDNAYVRGQTTVIAPQVSGYVIEVTVRDYQQVKRGQVLARIDDRIYLQRVEQARAQLAAQIANLNNSAQSERVSEAHLAGDSASVTNARAQLVRAEADMRRASELAERGFLSKRDQERMLAALRQAQAAELQAEAQQQVATAQVRTVNVGRGGLLANVEGAKASLRLAEIDLANTVIRAPQDGRLGEVGVRLGQYVTAGSQLTFLVPPDVWVAANFKEGQTAHVAPGQPATLRIDALDNAEIRGRVEEVAPAAGNEFQIIKSDNATGNFVKVPQRITVRILPDRSDPLYARMRPGMSVEVRIDTSSGH